MHDALRAGRTFGVQPSLVEMLQGTGARLLSHLPGSALHRLVLRSSHVVEGMTLDPHVQLVRAVRVRHDVPMRTRENVVERRAIYRREVASVAGAPTPVGRVRDVDVEGASGTLAARHYAPPVGGEAYGARAAGAASLLVYYHGGGFAIGDLETHDEPCRLLARHAGMHVLSVAYRLAPEYPFPAPVDDSIAALRWAMRNAESLGADPRRVGVGGDSAGGNLAAVAALELARGGTPPVAQLLIYPTTDAEATTPSRTRFGEGYFLDASDIDGFRDLYLGSDVAVRRDPRVSPLRAPDLHLAPPALVVTAGFDALRDEGVDYAEALRLSGATVRYLHFEPLVHGFLHMTSVSPAARRATIAIAAEWKALVGGSAPAAR